MPRVRLNDNCHGKVLFISDSVKKIKASCKLLKKLPENQVIKFIWPNELWFNYSCRGMLAHIIHHTRDIEQSSHVVRGLHIATVATYHYWGPRLNPCRGSGIFPISFFLNIICINCGMCHENHKYIAAYYSHKQWHMVTLGYTWGYSI